MTDYQVHLTVMRLFIAALVLYERVGEVLYIRGSSGTRGYTCWGCQYWGMGARSVVWGWAWSHEGQMYKGPGLVSMFPDSSSKERCHFITIKSPPPTPLLKKKTKLGSDNANSYALSAVAREQVSDAVRPKVAHPQRERYSRRRAGTWEDFVRVVNFSSRRPGRRHCLLKPNASRAAR